MDVKRWFLCAAVCAALLSSPAWGKNYVYILTGQSNSLGAVKGTPAPAELLERCGSAAKLWNGNMVRDTGERFESSPAWQAVVPQLPAYSGNMCMGPEVGFAHMMQRRGWRSKGEDALFIIKASLDGGGNSFWLPGGAAWKSLTGTISAALKALPGEAKVQALLYLQGESDKGEEISLAPARFLDLQARLGKELKKGSLRCAVAGECATWGSRETKDDKGHTTAELMYAMTRKKKNVGWVRTRDLSKITSGDNMGVHYDGKSQLSIGARYAYAVAELEKLPFSPARGDDREAALDSPAAWWGGKLPTAQETATWDMAAANVEERLGKDMAVGGLRVEDPFRGGVRLSPAERKKPTLSVGEQGILLENGDLELGCALHVAAPQRWKLAAGRTLSVGTTGAPVELIGSAVVSVEAPADAVLELHVNRAPALEWKLPAEPPQLRATIGGKPARMEKQGKLWRLVESSPL